MLIGITLSGGISFFFKCWGGRATDKYIIHHIGFLNKMEHGDIMLVDEGFDIADDLGIHGARLEIPSFVRLKKQLSLKFVYMYEE